MKTFRFFYHIGASLLLISAAGDVFCQTVTPRSAQASAQYDAESIAGNIADDHDVQFFSQEARDRGGSTEVKELADEMFTNFTGLLYSVEQLAVAGAGASGNAQISEKATKETQEFFQKISSARGFNLDTVWISGMLSLQQTIYNKLLEQKDNATNPRLKAAVTEAIPVVRKYITRLITLQKTLIKRDVQQKKEEARKLKENAKTRR